LDLFFFIFCSFAVAKKLNQSSCTNAPAYSVTAWSGGSYVTYNGKCYRARTVGASGGQTPWDSSTYNSISGWDVMTTPKPVVNTNPCQFYDPNCIQCNTSVCQSCSGGLSASGTKCISAPVCTSYSAACLSCSSKACLTCASGYALAMGGSTCICATNYAWNGKTCVKVQTSTVCNGVQTWSSSLAVNSGGVRVQLNGVLYQSMWGGTAAPGTNLCSSQSDCSMHGYQWITISNC